MDPNNLSKAKLAGLRTFATDREGRNKPTTSDTEEKTEEPVKPVSVPKPPVSKNGKNTASLPIPPRKHQEKIPERKPIIENDSNLQKIIANEMKETVVNEDIVAEKTPSVKEPTEVVTPVLAAAKTSHANPAKRVHIEGEEYEAATIITDTKKDRFHLFSATIQSIKDWFKDFKKARAAKKAPKYTVPEVSRRKGLVQKATSNTAIATSADYKDLASRIKQRHASEQKQPEIITTENVEPIYEKPNKKDSLQNNESLPTPPPSADIKTENQPLTEETTAKEIETKPKEEKNNIPPPPPKETEKEVVVKEETKTEEEPDTESVIDEQHSYSDPNSPRWSTDEWSSLEDKVPQEEKGSSNEKEIKKIEKPTNADIYTAQINQGPVIPPPSNKKKRRNIFFETNTNLLSFIISAIILFIFLAIGLGLIWYQNKTNNTYSSVIKDYTGVIEGKTSFLYDPMSSKDQFIKTIVDEYKNEDNRTTQFAISTTPDNQNVVRPDIILDFIDINLNNDFRRSISQLYFGSEDGKNPYLALKITDQTVSLAGMLNWEDNMRDNLALLFELETNQNLATTTNNQVSTTTKDGAVKTNFIDGTLSGVDVRVLKDENGEEELVYGFVKPNTVIITTNSRSFGRLTEMVK